MGKRSTLTEEEKSTTWERPTGVTPNTTYNSQGYPATVNSGSTTHVTSGHVFGGSSGSLDLGGAVSSGLAKGQPAAEIASGVAKAANGAQTQTTHQTGPTTTGDLQKNISGTGNGSDDSPAPSGGYVTESTPAASTPAPSYDTTVPDLFGQYNQGAQPIDDSLPSYQFDPWQSVGFNYNGQTPEFSYDGKTPEFKLQQADPAFQKQYQDTMAALEKMKGQAPTYGSQYDSQIQDLYQQILNRGPFQYDSKTDPLYQQYVQDYTMLGKQAARNVMGQAAGLTGGYGSSYGQAVGQQQYDQYLQRLADVLPQTYGMALDAYNAQGNEMRQNLATTMELEQSDYARYLDSLDKYYRDLDIARSDADTAFNRLWNAENRAYDWSVDEYGRAVDADDRGYRRAQDAYERGLDADDRNYRRAQDERDREIEEIDRRRQYQQDEYDRLIKENEIAHKRAVDTDNRNYNRTYDAYERQGAELDRLAYLMSMGYEPTAEDWARAGLSEAQGMAMMGHLKPQPETETQYVYVNRGGDNGNGGDTGSTGGTSRSIGDYISKYKSLSGKEKDEFDAAVRSDIDAGNVDFDLATWKYAKGR